MKLTAEIRKDIKCKICQPAIDAEEKLHNVEWQRICYEFYKSKHDEETIENLKNSPNGAFATLRDLSKWIYVDGKTLWRFSISEEYASQPCLFSFYVNGIDLKSGNKIADDFLKEANRHDSIIQDLRKKVGKAEQILKSCSTDSKLKEVWSEISSIVDEVCGKQPMTKQCLITIPQELSSTFNLPPEKKG